VKCASRLNLDASVARNRCTSTQSVCVQVGVFPFDHKEHLDPNTTAAYMEVWLQQVQTSFSELPHIQEQIAKEVRITKLCSSITSHPLNCSSP